MGVMPWWYPLLRAARYLGVAPWDLAERPAVWMFRALVAERAEIRAAEDRARHED
jgi:hypothetical protein